MPDEDTTDESFNPLNTLYTTLLALLPLLMAS